MLTGSKLWILLAVLSGTLYGCQALLDPGYPELVRDITLEVQELVEAKADAGDILTDAQVQALIERSIAAHTKGTPLEGAGLGALATSVVGLLGTFLIDRRKNSRKRGEMWAAIKSTEAGKS